MNNKNEAKAILANAIEHLNLQHYAASNDPEYPTVDDLKELFVIKSQIEAVIKTLNYAHDPKSPDNN